LVGLSVGSGLIVSLKKKSSSSVSLPNERDGDGVSVTFIGVGAGEIVKLIEVGDELKGVGAGDTDSEPRKLGAEETVGTSFDVAFRDGGNVSAYSCMVESGFVLL
jgi:hypothetical protein